MIPVEDIKKIEVLDPIEKWRITAWGLSWKFDIWWAADFLRAHTDHHCILLDTGSWPLIGLTPDHGSAQGVSEVKKLLEQITSIAGSQPSMSVKGDPKRSLHARVGEGSAADPPQYHDDPTGAKYNYSD